MIDDIGKWYAIVSTHASSDTLEKRKKAVASLAAHLTKKGNQTDIPAAVEGVAWRFGRGASFQGIVAESIEAEGLSHAEAPNRLELRLIAGLALGEIIDKPTSDTQAAVTCSMLLLSALGIPRQESTRARKIAEFMKALHESARRMLEAHASNMRHIPSSSPKAEAKARFDEMHKAMEAVSPQDSKQAWTAISPHLKGLFEGLQTRLAEVENSVRIDREELNVLWWTYSSRSTTTGDSFSGMKPGMAALFSGRELADLVLLPPPSNSMAFISEAISQRSQRGPAPSLTSIVGDWELESLRRSNSAIGGDDVQYPGVFPLTWIAHRLVESEMSADWKRELEVRVGVPPEQAMPLVRWAEQAMWERSGLRLLKR